MNIHPIESGPVATIGYLVVDEQSQDGVIIDTPPESADTFISIVEAKQIRIVGILLTHTHWDHTADCAELQRLTNAPVYVHKSDYHRLENPMAHSIFPLTFQIEPVYVNSFINHNDIIKCGNLQFEVRHTPGHTEGGVCYIEHKNRIIFSGDTLFQGSIGRTDLPGGDFDKLLESINNELLTLSDDYKIYCGHGNPTTIGVERISNPFINVLI